MKKTLITGAGSGIGLGIAQKFYKEGHELILIVHKKKQNNLLKKIFKKNCKIIIADLSKSSDLKKISKNVKYVDNIINNAGVSNKDFFTEVHERDFEYLMKVNFKSYFILSQLFAKKMIKYKIKGNIISISSQLGHVGAFNRSLYCSSKFAIEGFTKSVAMDLGEHGIKVNTIAPTKTIVNDFEMKKQKKRLAFIRNKIPLRKFSKIEEIAGIAFFLTTKSANSITGTSIKVDGGWTAGK